MNEEQILKIKDSLGTIPLPNEQKVFDVVLPIIQRNLSKGRETKIPLKKGRGTRLVIKPHKDGIVMEFHGSSERGIPWCKNSGIPYECFQCPLGDHRNCVSPPTVYKEEQVVELSYIVALAIIAYGTDWEFFQEKASPETENSL